MNMRKALLVGCIALAACGGQTAPIPAASAVLQAVPIAKGGPAEGLRAAKRVGCAWLRALPAVRPTAFR